jgi:RNA polymerase sigma factor (sigma-70 family)
MSEHDYSVYIVDDDPSIRDSLSLLLSLRGYRSALFATAEDFLQALDPAWRGCVVADIRMPGMTGLELQAELKRRGSKLPVVIITAHGEVASARAALLADAVDFLQKPFEEEQLLAAIRSAMERERTRSEFEAGEARYAAALADLTAREREVHELVIQGMQNRQIAEQLAISPRTVEVHKARVMQKLQVRDLAELIRLAQGRPR